MKKLAALRAKIYSFLKDNNDEDKKKRKLEKKCVIKRKVKFGDYKHCLEVTQLENKINHLEKNNPNVDNLRENKKEFIKNNKLTLKAQQRFKSERQNVFTEEINNSALGSNDDKRMQ